MKIDRDTVKLLRGRLQARLEELEAEFQMEIKVGNASFTEHNVTFKVECAVIDKNGEVLNKEAESFKVSAVFYGLKPDDLGKSFYVMGHNYTIVGLKKSSRFPVIGERKDGKRFKFDAKTVKATLLNK
jgi:hypothetical protein